MFEALKLSKTDRQVAGEVLREIASTPDEPNMGDPATLVSFVTRAMKEFPAKRYALVFGDHGLSWPGVQRRCAFAPAACAAARSRRPRAVNASPPLPEGRESVRLGGGATGLSPRPLEARDPLFEGG